MEDASQRFSTTGRLNLFDLFYHMGHAPEEGPAQVATKLTFEASHIL